MRIVRKETDFQGSEIYVAHIDMQGLPIENPYDFDLVDLDFQITTYRHLSSSPDDEAWDNQLKTINDFLATLSEQDRLQIGRFFIEAYVYINREVDLGASLKDVATHLGSLFYDVVIPMGLPQKLIDFTQRCIPIPDTSQAGSRAHDTPEKTFGHEDFIRVTAMALLCKLLCPIWGDLIHKLKRTTDINSKEMQCLLVVTPVLTCNEFTAIDQKLKGYIESGVAPSLSATKYTYGQKPAFTAAVNGFSPRRLYDYVYATILVKKFVNVNPYEEGEGCNIMKYIYSCINTSHTTLNSTLKKSNIGERFEPGDYKDGDEEGNVSFLEHESHASTVTADVPTLMRFGAIDAADKLVQELHIPQSLYHGAIAYYQRRPFVANILSQALVSLMFGRRMGGAKGIRYLDAITFMRLTIVLQIYVARTWQSQLVHLLTASTPTDPKVDPPTITDGRIAISYKQFYEYTNCEKNVYPFPVGGRSFDDLMHQIVTHIISYHHYVNVDPMIQAVISDDLALGHGDLVPYDELVVQDVCKVIINLLELNAKMEA